MIFQDKLLREYFSGQGPESIDKMAEAILKAGFESEIDKTTSEITVDITPNRSDCISYFGLAKEVSAVIGLERPSLETLAITKEPQSIENFLDLNDLSWCLKSAQLLEVRLIKPRPECHETWRLIADKYGLKKERPLVDLGNIVGLEVGAWLHIFDAAAVGSGLKLAFANDHDSVTLINGQKVELNKACLVQLSEHRIVDLAGIRGGLVSAVGATTEKIIIQATNFQPEVIATSSLALGIKTDASKQFSRGIASERFDLALCRYLFWLNKLYEFEIINNYHLPQESSLPISYSLERLSLLLGKKIDLSDWTIKLEKLGYVLTSRTEFLPPKDRIDVVNETVALADYLRLTDLEIKKPLTKLEIGERQPNNVDNGFKIAKHLADHGWTETQTESLTSSGAIKLASFQSESRSFYRASLKNSLLESAKTNPYIRPLNIFEIGRVANPDERTKIGLVTSIKNASTNFSVIDEVEWLAITEKELKMADVKHSRLWFKELDLPRVENLKISNFPELKRHQPVFKLQSPPIIFDCSFIVPDDITTDTFYDQIKPFFTNSQNYFGLELVDQYQSASMEANNQKSITVRVFYLARTDDPLPNLVGSAIKAVFDQSIKNIESELHYQSR